MQTQIVQVGNSLGVRLPKAVLDGMSLTKSSRLEVQRTGDAIVLRPARTARQGWAAALAGADAAAENLWGELPLSEGWDATR